MSLSTLKQVKRVDLVLNDLNKHLPSINLETFTCKLCSMEKGFTPFFCGGILRGSNTVITWTKQLKLFKASLTNYEWHRIFNCSSHGTNWWDSTAKKTIHPYYTTELRNGVHLGTIHYFRYEKVCPKCVLQLFLGSSLGANRSAIAANGHSPQYPIKTYNYWSLNCFRECCRNTQTMCNFIYRTGEGRT